MKIQNINKKITFCKKCVESNQRYMGSIQHTDKKGCSKTMSIFEENVCGACKYYEQKKLINWKEREKEFKEILDKYRKNDSYDVLLPGSGGKDTIFLSHVLKYKIQNEPFDNYMGPSHLY